MNIFHAILLGIVEGVTEFLPISSTFHLLMTSTLLHLPQSEFSKFFDVFIQAGAILAVVVIFAREWFSNWEVLKKVAAAFVPTAIVGFLLHGIIKDVLFNSTLSMVVVFVAVGFVFLAVEQWLCKHPEHGKKTLSDMTWAQAVGIGLAQSLAVMPGVSRAGAVIIAMLLMGYNREDSAKFSFTLAVPTILAAAGLDLLKSRHLLTQTGSSDVMLLIVGSVVAFVSAFIVVKWFIHFLRTQTFRAFGWYRIVAGAALFWLVR